MTRSSHLPKKVRYAHNLGKTRKPECPRRLFPAAGTLLLGILGCDPAGLPAEYRALAVPEVRLTSPDARARGRALFLEHCALCHGERADGRGRRRILSVQPTDFTDATWRQRMTPRRVFFVVREGIRQTPMPAWKILSRDQTWDIVAYVLSVAEGEPTAEDDFFKFRALMISVPIPKWHRKFPCRLPGSGVSCRELGALRRHDSSRGARVEAASG
jgi:mono/diheme cytochrome c family protein